MSDNIKVTVRVRPFIKRELGDAAPASHWDIQDDHGIVQVHPASCKPLSTPYIFDDVFGPDMQNEDVYREVAMPIIESALTGFNGTIFVYGQTSSGKTFTMMGDRSSPGIVPLAVQNIFRIIEDTPDREYLIRASYMEIYNENISDLLAGQDTRGRSLNIREDLSGAVYVGDLKEEYANCEEQLLKIIKRGEKNRHTASTNMNERSSRSHTIFRLILESRERGDEAQEEGAVTVSHLNLVDLAGSENASQSGATGERLREGGFINKSLFMLGRVISQLSEGESFVNFRDSKLTRILQTSLGGNSKTAIICTVTPAAVEQTHSTLRFASRAKAIKNKPVVNEVLSDAALLKRYAREIKALQHTLALERNTDKNQEVEQVREMFEEQARRNEELQAKVMELQTKLVVSSLPRGCPRNPMDKKKKKARRETWCAPAIRNSRMSMGHPLLPTLPSCVEEHKFVQPRLPPWTETSICSESACSDTSLYNIENSLSQEEFGKDDISFVLNQAEKSKLDGQDFLPLDSPYMVNTSRRKKRRVKFDVAPSPPQASDIGCQTEESLMRLFAQSLPSTPQGTPLSVKLPGTPSTPSHVLRARNQELRDKLREKEDWLSDWQREMETLKEFHRMEIKTLEESFDGKVAAFTENHPRLEASAQETEHLKEIASLRRSVQDYEQLLMDANRELSLNVQNSADLQRQLETLSEENIQLSGLQEEVVKLRDENKMLKKDLEVKECRLSKCENERNDFDMEMELALEKQKQKEAYLQNNLEEAWREIAAYEKGDVEEVKKNWQRLAELELMVSTATTAQGTTQSSDALDQQLVKVQQEADELRVELLEVSQQMEQVKKENDELRQEVKDLQEHLSEVLSRQGSDRILSLKEEVENLKKRLEEAEKIQQHKVEGEEEMRLSSPVEVMTDRRGEEGSTMVSQDFSRALSETIQALEESICVATPGRRSFGTWLDSLSPRDLEAARPLVETLKAGLSALQEHMQVMEQQQQETAYATDHCLQIAAEMEKELNTWKTQESFIGDYVLHAMSSRQPKQSSTHACPSPPHGKSEEAVHKAVQEACSRLKAEYEAKLTAFENRGRFNSKSETLYFSFSLENDTPSGVPGQSERREDTVLDASFFSLGSHSNNTEVKELKGQLELLTQENSELLNLVKALQDAGNATSLAAAAVEGKTRTPDTCMSEPACPEGKCALDGVSWEQEVESASPSSEPPSAAPQSLADELRQAGMNLTMLNETFETSVVMPVSVTNPNSDTLELRQQLCVLEQEKVQLQDKVCSLQDTLRQMKEKKSSIIEKSAEEETVYIDQLESEVQRLKEECLNQTTHIKTLQDEMNSRNSVNKIEIQDSTATIIEEEKMKSEWKVYELEEKLGYQNFAEKEKQEEVNHLRDQIKKLEEEKLSMETKLLMLEEKLSCMSLIEEELHSLQWQVTTLKEEKSDLEKELVFMQDEVEKLTEQNEQLSYKTECKAQVEADGAKESNAGPTSDHADTEIENASVLQQKTKELEEAKEEIEVLKQEVEKMHRVSEESCADVKNEDNAKEVEEKIMELQESKEKIEYLKEEIEKVSAKCQNELAEKENELEMMITNFMEKEEAFENTEKQLKRANIDLKDSLANKDLELQNIKNRHEEEYVKVTAELEEMKKTLIQKDLELQRVNSQLDQMKAEADHMPDNKVMSELEENLQTLKQEYVDLQAQSEEKLVEAQASMRKFEEKYNNCLQDYIAASQACEENRLMLMKSEEEKEILKEKLDSEVKRYEEEKGALQLKYENERHKSELEKENHESKVKKYEEEKENLWVKYGNELQRSELEKEKHESEVKKYEEERENLRLRYENELQQSEEEKENLTVKYKCEIQKHVEQKENLKLKYESEIASATAARESRSREALGFSVQSTVEQKLDEMETLKDSLEEKVKECDCLKDTVDNLKVVLGKKQEELLKLTAEHQEEVAFYVDNLSEKEKVAKDLENETRRRSEEVASLTSALTAKDHRLHRLEKDLANTQKELEDKETELHDGMDRLRKDYEEVCAEKSRMSEDMRSLEEAKETITYKCSSLRAQLDNLEEDFLQIKEELEAGKKEIQLKQEVICSLEAAQERLKEELDCVRAKETELLDQQVTSSHKIEKLVEEIEKYKCEMFEKENQIVAISEDLASKTGSSERLAKDLQELHEQLEDKCREQEEAERRCEVLEEKLESSMAEADKMQGQIMQLSAAKDKILTLEEKCKDLEKMCESRKALERQQRHQPEDLETDMMENKACKKMIHRETLGDASTMKDSSGHAKAPACEDCIHYKSLVERLNRFVEEKETQHERKMAEVAIQHNKSVNVPSFDTPANTSTQGTRRSRVALMEQKNDRLSFQLVQCYEKVKRLEETLENMRRTNGVISQDVEMQKELSWMWEKMQEAEKKLKLLNENYDLLEMENEELRKSLEQQEGEKKMEATENVVLEMQERCSAVENKYMLLQEEYKALLEKFKSVGNDISSKEHYDSLKNNHDSLKDELHSLQKKYSALRENYTMLQETYDTLQETHRMLQEIHSSVQAAHNTLQETHNTLQDKYNTASDRFEALQEKFNNLLKAHNSSRDSSHDNTLGTTQQEPQCDAVAGRPPMGVVAAVSPHSEAGDLRERLAAAERENDELKFRLMANDAPSRKKVQLLTEELRIAERKISHLKGELRRQQEAGCGDSTIYELTGQSTQQQEEGKAKSEPDYSSGSSIVNQVVVMELQNKLYHIEKDKKKLESEQKVVQQHVDHYLAKAREWKVKATKEEQAAQKARKERDEMYDELKKYLAKVEELSSKLERQQFELGHQRELIQKMEKQPSSATSATPSCVQVPWATPASRESRGAPVTPALATIAGGIGKGMMATQAAGGGPGTGTEGNISAAQGGADAAKDKDKQRQDERPATRLLGLHNAPLPYHTRIEKLPFMKDVQTKETRDEVPMWKSRKENEDISKYRLPPEERRKPSEDCKTQ